MSKQNEMLVCFEFMHFEIRTVVVDEHELGSDDQGIDQRCKDKAIEFILAGGDFPSVLGEDYLRRTTPTVDYL